MTTFARAERLALADLMAEVGPDAPTLCDPWTVRDLAAHLLLRERRPDAASGILFKRFAGRTERIQRLIAARDFTALLHDLRNPPWYSHISNPVFDGTANLTEMFVHHEDVRRAQPEWEPRELSPEMERALWGQVRFRTRMYLRRFPFVIHVEAPGFGAARGGAATAPDSVRVTGSPGELLMFLFGRQAYSEAIVDGPAASAQRLRRASLGI